MTKAITSTLLFLGGYVLVVLALGVSGGAMAHGWELARALM